MNFDLNEEQVQVRELARRFADEEIAPAVEANELAMRFPRDLMQKMGELGFFGAAFPKQYGGTEMGYLFHALICEEVSRVHSSLRTPFNLQAMTGAGTILEYGTLEQKKRWVPGLVKADLMGLFGINLRVSTVVAFSICLGMAVDDTIHYLTRFREELDRTGDYIASMYSTFQSAGRAIVLTTSMLIAGFLVFVSSDFRATHDLGLLSSVALTSSLLGSLVFLPAALNTLKPWKIDEEDEGG